jgi:hypothetical protein
MSHQSTGRQIQTFQRIYVGDPKIPGIVKKIYLKYLYKFETLVPFEVLPL